MLTGSHSINMDAKGRMAIPTRIRESLVASCDGRLVLTAHTQERCLLVYPEPDWQEKLPTIQALPTLDPAARRIQRLWIGYATPVEMDGNGRILVPPTLRSFASLDKKLMLVGLGDKMELWNEDSWHQLLEEPVQTEISPELQSLTF
ncbi:division/cell wall cluster transcriptional repressor MraZ [Marinimicrobium agarilyticum]|uniref:division/cell wall cluster transcriptional repressor MraZ n=1 Tax=Marinimicrobium agarilyticum TaxID=306546 RepID=UPI0004827846|nr:division/cell wall cluster transcriptional repressor MraZ [Marinimicrobium agarilyticum]